MSARDRGEHTIKLKTKTNTSRLLGRLPLPCLHPFRHRTRESPITFHRQTFVYSPLKHTIKYTVVIPRFTLKAFRWSCVPLPLVSRVSRVWPTCQLFMTRLFRRRLSVVLGHLCGPDYVGRASLFWIFSGGCGASQCGAKSNVFNLFLGTSLTYPWRKPLF